MRIKSKFFRGKDVRVYVCRACLDWAVDDPCVLMVAADCDDDLDLHCPIPDGFVKADWKVEK